MSQITCILLNTDRLFSLSILTLAYIVYVLQ